MTALPSPLLLFDGECALCDHCVQFVLDHDREGRVHFASLQSDLGRRVVAECRLAIGDTDSVVLVEEGVCHVRSDAALRVAEYLDAPWRWLAVARIVPRSVRDAVYRWVARHRYRWFGARVECRIPSAETRSRFVGLDDPAPNGAPPPSPVARGGERS